MKILILEDDQIFGGTLELFLTQQGYDVEWVTCIEDAENITFDQNFDLYLFDINLPDGRGLTLLDSLRFAEDNTPTIFITALVDMESMAEGFKLGALDYIKKPFNPAELLIRIEAKFKQETIFYGNIEFEPNTQMIRVNKKIIDIGLVPTCVFEKLIKNIGTTVSKEELLECLDHPSANALRVAITKIKQKLNIEITNIRAKGYLLEEI